MSNNSQTESIMSPEEKLQTALNIKPEIIILGAVERLSRRIARKLAYIYRGSRRGVWYENYLEGFSEGFRVTSNRLVKLPRMGSVIFKTFHSESAVPLN